ncbi:transcription factor WhiB, partial [Rarobacter faecitabidus]
DPRIDKSIPWQESAPCRENPDTFYPEDVGRTKQPPIIKAAVAICRECPFQRECLTEAVETERSKRGIIDNTAGIRAGITADMRRDVYRVARSRDEALAMLIDARESP